LSSFSRAEMSELRTDDPVPSPIEPLADTVALRFLPSNFRRPGYDRHNCRSAYVC
jgi:hypothetical protein